MFMKIRQATGRQAAGGTVLVLALLVGGGSAGCTGAQTGSTAGQPAPAGLSNTQQTAAVPMGSMVMPTSEQASAIWDARPAFVRDADPETQTAYAFALARPDVLQWLPCYCGCAAMGHKSNLDCFFQRQQAGPRTGFEQHASGCDVCVKIAVMGREMLRQGKTMIQIRAAVDAAFGGGAPGTLTELPPT
jgi:uncharacterized protein with PCYCGC motif